MPCTQGMKRAAKLKPAPRSVAGLSRACSHTWLALLLAQAAVLCASGCASTSARSPGKESTMPSATQPALRYGFRYSALDAARLRAEASLPPLRGDRARINIATKRCLRALSGDDPTEVARAALKALALGCPADTPEIRRAATSMLEELKRAQAAGVAGKLTESLAALCQAGFADAPAVRRAVADGMEELMRYDAANAFGPGVARTPNQRIMRLWLCREAADIAPVLDHWMNWMDAGLDETGCGSKVGLFLLWDVLQIMGSVDHPVAARRARQLVPILQRMQQPDGSLWDGWNYEAGHLLLKYKLFDAVRDRPPLPADWKVTRSIPVAVEKPFSIAWDGTRLWVQDQQTHAAYALDPKDGRQLAKVALPGPAGQGVLGAGPGCLYLAIGGDERMLYRIDPATGQTSWKKPFHPRSVLGVAEARGGVMLADHWDGHMHETSAADPAPADQWTTWRSAAGMPNFITAAGDDAMWISDGICPLLIKTARDGRLLDWGEKPFGWGGIAFDGSNLWALDRAGSRLCAIVKADTAGPEAGRR
jgi:hypothetical protein